MPAAYYENLDVRPTQPWPDYLNLQGVNDFDPSDPLYYAMEHCVEPRVKQLRWVNDTSVNLQYYSAEEAALALQALTHPDAGEPSAIPLDTPRKARPYSKRPELALIIRQANSGDQKARGAANRSNYYRHNPEVRGDRGDRGDRGGDRGGDRDTRRRPPRRAPDILDYDGVESSDSRRRYTAWSPLQDRLTSYSHSRNERMRDDSDFDNRRTRRYDTSERGGRPRGDVDSWRPGSRRYETERRQTGRRLGLTYDSPRESRFGRLRGRSASPASGEEGDGRYGFTEEGAFTKHRYRSRSPGRNDRRRREPSGERWTHDRAHFSDRGESSSERWSKDTSAMRYSDAFASSSNHRRSDAFDETANSRKGSLLSRMTKDGQPLASQGRSLASRMTRDDDGESSFGRLKYDSSDVQHVDFSEPAPKRGLASRITRDDDDIQIRGKAEQLEGINIRGSASQQGGFSIRGMAGGA